MLPKTARTRQSPIITFIFKNGPEAPQLWRGRLSLSLSLSSTNQNFKKTTFLLVNFKNDHDKRCLVSRDWQPQKISAQSVPISQNHYRKPDFSNVKERITFQVKNAYLWDANTSHCSFASERFRLLATGTLRTCAWSWVPYPAVQLTELWCFMARERPFTWRYFEKNLR